MKLSSLSSILPILFGLLICVISLYIMPRALQFYFSHTEIKEFSYQALVENLERYPDDQRLLEQVREVLMDNEIVGYEHRMIAERLIKRNGLYYGVTIGVEMDDPKLLLMSMVKPRIP